MTLQSLIGALPVSPMAHRPPPFCETADHLSEPPASIQNHVSEVNESPDGDGLCLRDSIHIQDHNAIYGQHTMTSDRCICCPFGFGIGRMLLADRQKIFLFFCFRSAPMFLITKSDLSHRFLV
jgi:hypothetical protein